MTCRTRTALLAGVLTFTLAGAALAQSKGVKAITADGMRLKVVWQRPPQAGVSR